MALNPSPLFAFPVGRALVERGMNQWEAVAHWAVLYLLVPALQVGCPSKMLGTRSVSVSVSRRFAYTERDSLAVRPKSRCRTCVSYQSPRRSLESVSHFSSFCAWTEFSACVMLELKKGSFRKETSPCIWVPGPRSAPHPRPRQRQPSDTRSAANIGRVST